MDAAGMIEMEGRETAGRKNRSRGTAPNGVISKKSRKRKKGWTSGSVWDLKLTRVLNACSAGC
jgi:hypothetical protein